MLKLYTQLFKKTKIYDGFQLELEILDGEEWETGHCTGFFTVFITLFIVKLS